MTGERIKPVWRAAAAMLMLAGCANWNAVYREEVILANRPVFIAEDAKQRNVFMFPDVDADGNKTGNWRVCAEAAPDVFSALSASAAARLTLEGKDQNAEAAFAIAETAATIERTQTINLLRESFYRTCERYLGGAITKSAFVVQAGRDWRAMIAILAIEQLTRTARAPATILVAGGTSASITSPADWVRALREADADIDRAEQELSAVTTANSPAADAACDTGTVDEIATCTASKTAAKDKIDRASNAVKSAEKRREDVLELSESAPPGTIGAKTEPGTAPRAGEGEGERSGSDLKAVAATVEKIALRALETNEMQLFCIQKIESQETIEERLYKSCLSLLSAAANFEAREYRTELATLEAARAARVPELINLLAREDWKAAWDAAIDSIGIRPASANELKAVETRDAAARIFGEMRAQDQQEVLNSLRNGKG